MIRGRILLIGVVALPAVLFGSQPGHAQDVRAAVEQLAGQIAKGVQENRQLRLAVTDFPDLQGVTCELGRFISSRLTTRLTQAPKFLMVERQRLSQVLGELKFSMSDLIDPAKAKQLGKMVGVDAIVIGSISDFGNQMDIDARIIDIETNHMVFGTSVTLGKDPSVSAMRERGCQEASAASSQPTKDAIQPGQASRASVRPTMTGQRFKFEFLSAEHSGDKVTLHFLVTNQTNEPQYLGFDCLLCNDDQVYVVDEDGGRHKMVQLSYRQGINQPPGVPIRQWMSFQAPPARTGTLTLFYTGLTMRGIRLHQ